MKNITTLKDKAYELISEGEFHNAKKLIEEALNMDPEDITVLELYDFWYHENEELEEEEKLLGSLKIIDKMLELHPAGTNDVFDEADYYPNLYHIRVDLLGRLAQETYNIKILKQALDGYDALIEKEGLVEYLNAVNRLATLNLVIDEIDYDEAQKVLGDVTALRLRYMDDLASTGNPAGWVEKGDYLTELQRYKEAIDAYKPALGVIENYPEYSLLGLKIAKCQLQLGNYAEALKSCDDIKKGVSDKFYIQAKALAKLEQFDEALEKLKSYIISDPDDISVKTEMRIDPDFIKLWNNEIFLEITSDPNLNLDYIGKIQKEILDQKG